MKKSEVMKEINEIQQLLSMDENARQIYIKEHFGYEVDYKYSQSFMVGVVDAQLNSLKARL